LDSRGEDLLDVAVPKVHHSVVEGEDLLEELLEVLVLHLAVLVHSLCLG
jgi:hypothetical protein